LIVGNAAFIGVGDRHLLGRFPTQLHRDGCQSRLWPSVEEQSAGGGSRSPSAMEESRLRRPSVPIGPGRTGGLGDHDPPSRFLDAAIQSRAMWLNVIHAPRSMGRCCDTLSGWRLSILAPLLVMAYSHHESGIAQERVPPVGSRRALSAPPDSKSRDGAVDGALGAGWGLWDVVPRLRAVVGPRSMRVRICGPVSKGAWVGGWERLGFGGSQLEFGPGCGSSEIGVRRSKIGRGRLEIGVRRWGLGRSLRWIVLRTRDCGLCRCFCGCGCGGCDGGGGRCGGGDGGMGLVVDFAAFGDEVHAVLFRDDSFRRGGVGGGSF